MDVIYADELFALNALIDYVLLCLSARLASLPRRRGRFALAAALGGAYALGAAALPWLNAPGVKLAVSLPLALTAFGGPSLWRGWAALLATSALFAGTVVALALLGGQTLSGGTPAHLSLRVLLLAFGVCQGLVRAVLAYLDERRSRPTAEVTLTLGARRVDLRALRDTGNTLCDPLSGTRVLIADANALRPLLPGGIPGADLSDAAALYRALAREPALSSRLRLVPYAAVGGGGMLLCVRPDRVVVDGAEAVLLAAISPTPLARGDYNAIF